MLCAWKWSAALMIKVIDRIMRHVGVPGAGTGVLSEGVGVWWLVKTSLSSLMSRRR